jgi:eukaryotic-like serine/threonine-protein kinase
MNMTDADDNSADRRVNRILADYLQAVEAGTAPSREEFLTQYPEVAFELEEFLTNQAAIEQLAGAFPPLGEDVTLIGGDLSDSAPSATATAPGDRLRYFGDYELLEEIARGGMGVVYKARQVNLKRIVAVKLILAGELAGDADVRRFYSEAEAAARLDHPGIVSIFEVGQHQGQHYFSMAFVEGESLAHRISRGVLPARDAARYLQAVAEAIAYAHVEGIVHRDLKPANILLDKDDQPRVTDFGLAKRVEADQEMTATGQILGTPSYMPPEQASGSRDAVGPWSDIYALGAVLYCLVAGRPPFQAATPLDTLLQVLHQEPIPPRQLNASVPRDLDTICMKCLQKEPKKRYASAQELADELRRFLHEEPIHARPVGRWERSWRWCRRNPVVATLTAAVVLLVLSASAISVAAALRIHGDNLRLVEANGAQIAAEEAARQELYYNQITLSHLYWKGGDAGRADQLLNEAPAKYRAWEWQYVKRLCHAELLTLGGHTGLPMDLAYFPGGTKVVSVGGFPKVHPQTHGEIRIWNPETGELLQYWSGHDAMIHGVAVTADGQRIITGGEDRLVRIWDARNGELLKTLEGHRWPVQAVRLSQDGQFIASIGRRDQHDESSSGLLDQLRTISFVRGELRIWSANTGELVSAIESATTLSDVAFSPDASRAITVGNEVKIYDDQGREQQTLRGKGAWNYCVAYSPDGKQIAAGDDQLARVWDVDSGEERATFRGHVHGVSAIAFRDDGQRLLTAGRDHTIKIWQPMFDPAAAVLRHRFDVHGAVFSPDGQRLVAAAPADGLIFIHNPVSGAELARLRHPGVSAVAFTPSGDRLISAGHDSQIRVWNLDNLQKESASALFGLIDRRLVRTLRGHSQNVAVVACHPGGEQLASVSWDGTLRIWSLADGRELHQHHLGLQAYNVGYSPDGSALAATNGAAITVCDSSTGAIRWRHDEPQGGLVTLAYSPDGQNLASWRRGALLLLDSRTGSVLREYANLSTFTTNLVFDHSGTRLIMSCVDGSIRFIDLATGRETLTLDGHEGTVNAVRFDGSGNRLVSSGLDGTVRIWNATPLEQ